jgi:hypothetical protein
MMGSRGGHILADGSSLILARRVCHHPRMFLHLETLETRCLLSGWLQSPSTGLVSDRLLEQSSPTALVASGPSAGNKITAPLNDVSNLGPTQSASSDRYRDPGEKDGDPGGVVGTLAGDGVELYRLNLDSIPDRVDFGLVVRGSGANVPATFQLLDGAGNVLGTWKLGSLGNSSIQVDLDRPTPGSTLFLGISADSSASTGGAFTNGEYQLWVARQPALRPTAATTGGPPQLSLALSVLSPLLIPLASLEVSAARVDSASGLLTAPMNTSVSVSVAVGSLAMRSGGASRGLLSNDEPTKVAIPATDTLAPQEVIPGVIAKTELGRGDGSHSGQPAAERDAQANVALIGVGGFPLLGATAVGYWRERGPGPETLPAIAAPALEDGPESVESSGSLDLELSPSPSLAESGILAPDEPSPSRAWGRIPVSLFSSLGVATVLTLNAVLSQPIAGYDYLTARLYRSRNRSNSGRNIRPS